MFIPRRDSDSLLNVLVGGRLYPGEHHRARFEVEESATDLRVGYAALDGSARVQVSVRLSAGLDGSRLFPDVTSASRFFEQGSVGYSATRSGDRFDGLRLHTTAWRVEPVEVQSVESSFFDDARDFPGGSAVLDCGLLMRRIPVGWAALPTLAAPREVGVAG